MAEADGTFKEAYQKYVDAAKHAYSSGATEEDLDNAYKLYVECAALFWKNYDIKADKLPAENWEHFFAFTQTHSCSRLCVTPTWNCLGSVGTIGTYGTLGGCFGTAGTAGTLGTRGG